MWPDLLLAFRTLRTQRAFSLAAIVTLALGIGANSAIFSVIYAVLLRPLPFPEPERVIAIHNVSPLDHDPRTVIDAADYLDFRAAQQTMTDLAIVRYRENQSLTAGAEPEPVWGNSATPGLFRILMLEPLLGRTFTEEEGQPGKDSVMLISEGLWRRRFGADPGCVGRAAVVNGVSRTIVGILRDGLELQFASDVWLPLVPSQTEIQARFQHRYRMYGRLKPGLSLENAQQDFNRMNAELSKQYPKTNGYGIRLVAYVDDRVGAVRDSLTFLWLAAGLVLLIACANVANLLLARAASRQREIAIRAALGASRFRLMRQVLAESLLLSFAGGLAGIAVAAAGLRMILPLLPATLPGRSAIQLNTATLLYTLAGALVTGVLFGLSPALQAAGASAAESLRQRSPGSNTAASRLRAALVVAEIALSLVLLVGGSLLLRTLLQILNRDAGLNPAHVISMLISLPASRYRSPEAITGYYQRVVDRVSALPSIEAAGLISILPLGGSRGTGPMAVEGHPTPPSQTPIVDWRSVSPGYFRTLGITLIAGRGVDPHDTADAQQAVVIDDTLAAIHWPNQDPLGKRVKLGSSESPAPWLTVVGVVHTVRGDGLDTESRGQAYRPFPQYPIHGLPAGNMAVVARVSGAAAGAAESIRREILAVDSNQPAYEVRTMDDVVARSLAPRKFSATLVGFFAALALVLASIGVFGVISYLVALRTNEIGIRIALGASPFDVARLIGSQTAKLAGAGLVLGLAGSFAVAQGMKSLLIDVSPFDPFSFAIAGIVVAAIAMAASAQPARRAMKVDPVRALTTDL